MCCFSLVEMEIDCQPEDSVSSYEEDCVELGGIKDMRLEAEAVVNDVGFAVAEMHVSHRLNSALDVAYINVETREGNQYCVELTEAGLRVRCTHMSHDGFITQHKPLTNVFFGSPGGGLCF